MYYWLLKQGTQCRIETGLWHWVGKRGCQSPDTSALSQCFLVQGCDTIHVLMVLLLRDAVLIPQSRSSLSALCTVGAVAGDLEGGVPRSTHSPEVLWSHPSLTSYNFWDMSAPAQVGMSPSWSFCQMQSFLLILLTLHFQERAGQVPTNRICQGRPVGNTRDFQGKQHSNLCWKWVGRGWGDSTERSTERLEIGSHFWLLGYRGEGYRTTRAVPRMNFLLGHLLIWCGSSVGWWGG